MIRVCVSECVCAYVPACVCVWRYLWPDIHHMVQWHFISVLCVKSKRFTNNDTTSSIYPQPARWRLYRVLALSLCGQEFNRLNNAENGMNDQRINTNTGRYWQTSFRKRSGGKQVNKPSLAEYKSNSRQNFTELMTKLVVLDSSKQGIALLN